MCGGYLEHYVYTGCPGEIGICHRSAFFNEAAVDVPSFLHGNLIARYIFFAALFVYRIFALHRNLSYQGKNQLLNYIVIFSYFYISYFILFAL